MSVVSDGTASVSVAPVSARRVAQLQWRVLRRDRALLTAIAAFAVAVVVASWAGGRHAAQVGAGQDEATARATLRDKGHGKTIGELVAEHAPMQAQDPRDPAWMGTDAATIVATLPPGPLASVAVGQRSIQPQVVHVGTAVQLGRPLLSESPMVSAGRLAAGPLDPAFLFVVLLPLLVIASSYQLLSGERERGTLAMVLSQPVSQSALVRGKAMARGLVIAAATVFCALLGLVLGGVELGADGALVLVVLYLAVLLAWAAVWFAAAVLVNARGGSSERNALQLVGAWLAVVVVIPGLAAAALDAAVPPPDRLDAVHEVREAAEEAQKKLTALQGTHDRDPRKGTFGKELVAAQRAVLEKTKPVIAALEQRISERRALEQVVRFVSPAIVVQHALEAIAGSGPARQAAFEAQVAAVQARHRAHYFGLSERGELVTQERLAAAPKWLWQEPGVGAVVGAVLPGMALLVAIAVGLLAVAAPGLRRIGRLAR